jgi:hypothetical protein
MEAKRKDDQETRARFRSERVVKDGDEWYFCTREGTIQGPFVDEWEANYQLQKYIDIMMSDLAGELSLEPFEPAN